MSRSGRQSHPIRFRNRERQAGQLTSAVWHLRLAKVGDTYTAAYSADGTEWTTFEPLTSTALGDDPKVGLFSLSGNQTASKTVSFDYFRLDTGGSDDDTTAPVTTRTPAAASRPAIAWSGVIGSSTKTECPVRGG